MKGTVMTIRCIECGKTVKARSMKQAYKIVKRCMCERCRQQDNH